MKRDAGPPRGRPQALAKRLAELRQTLEGRRVEPLHGRDARGHGGRVAVEGARVRQDRRLPVGKDLHHLRRAAGNCRAAWSGGPAPWSFGQELFDDDLDRLEESLAAIHHRVPALETAGIKRVVNGAISFSPDGRPIAGPMPGVPGFFVACGFLGGIAQAGGIGLAMSQWILDGQPELDLQFIDVARFGDWTTREFARERTHEILPIRYELIYPGLERTSGRPLRTTPIHDDLLARGAVMGQVYGWERPLWYAPEGIEPKDEPSFLRPNWWEHAGNEARAMAAGCGLTEMTTYGKFVVTGGGRPGIPRPCRFRQGARPARAA